MVDRGGCCLGAAGVRAHISGDIADHGPDIPRCTSFGCGQRPCVIASRLDRGRHLPDGHVGGRSGLHHPDGHLHDEAGCGLCLCDPGLDPDRLRGAAQHLADGGPVAAQCLVAGQCGAAGQWSSAGGAGDLWRTGIQHWQHRRGRPGAERAAGSAAQMGRPAQCRAGAVHLLVGTGRHGGRPSHHLAGRADDRTDHLCGLRLAAASG